MPSSPQLLSSSQPSSSRKRSYAEDTRSRSRSLSPHSSKRRRTLSSSPVYHMNSYSSPSRPHSPPRRFAGDGFDYRRPVMASTNDNNDTIDLTLDDDTPPAVGQRSTTSPDFDLPSESTSPASVPAEPEQRRAPPFGVGDGVQPLEVIDLLDDEDETVPRLARRPRTALARSPSPEIQFVRERPAQTSLSSRRPDPPAQPASRREAWHPPQQPFGAIGRMMDFARQNTQNMFNNFNLPFIQMGPAAAQVRENGGLELVEGEDPYAINLNYEHAAFQVGNRESETPQTTIGEPYKAPPPASEGFVRTYEEESILICPNCEQELAAGGKDEDDPKRQVWVVKACGHVYCGNCSRSRANGKNSSKKSKRRDKQHEADNFKTCKIQGCSKPVTGKQGMIQIYL